LAAFFDSKDLPLFSTGLSEMKIERSISEDGKLRILLLLKAKEKERGEFPKHTN
jgi:hypothetical protein